jgi:guanylate kinase
MEERARRLDTARAELAAEAEFDVTVVNTEVHDASEQLVALMMSAGAHDRARPQPKNL